MTRLFERGISPQQVHHVVASGETIMRYPDDTPFPSELILGMDESRPLHVVLAHNKDTGKCHIVTACEPSPELWDTHFRTRKT